MIKYPKGIATKTIKLKSTSKKRGNKYHAHKIEIDGIVFDSKLESRYYMYLKSINANFVYQESFEIVHKFSVGGKNYSKRVYTPDFSIYEDGKLIKVVDCKGGKATLTDASSLRMVIFMSMYQVPVILATWNTKTKSFDEKQK